MNIYEIAFEGDITLIIGSYDIESVFIWAKKNGYPEIVNISRTCKNVAFVDITKTDQTETKEQGE